MDLIEPRFLPLRTEKWTVDELLELPEDQGYRIEPVDGTVLVSPASPVIHQRLLMRAMVAFAAATPSDYLAVHVVNVVFSDDRLLIPDLVVSNMPDPDAVYIKGSDVPLVLEVHSPATRAIDLTLKRQVYGDAGVPFLLFVDLEEGARLLELGGEGYREVASSVAGVLTTTRPFPLTLDLSGLR